MNFKIFHSAVAMLGVAFFLAAQSAPAATEDGQMLLYIGTGGGPGKGIFVTHMNTRTGELAPAELAIQSGRPSFLAIRRDGKFLYAVDEVNGKDGSKAGSVGAFSIDKSSGKLALVNRQTSGGGGPAHVSLSPDEKFVAVANYGTGSIEVIPVKEDGSLAEPTAFVQHHGTGPNPKRQDKPHAHSAYFDATEHWVLTADLGIDKVLAYRFDSATGKFDADHPSGGKTAPGSGPRHLVFSKDGKFAFVVTEMGNTVTSFSWNAESGELKEVQTISTLPADFKQDSFAAGIRITPSGRFLYASNRGHNSIATFEVEEASGKLTARGNASVAGNWPRDIEIDPSGQFLLNANEKSNNVTVLKIDEKTGALSDTGFSATVPGPMCVRFVTSQ